jgi:hypothetical protein
MNRMFETKRTAGALIISLLITATIPSLAQEGPDSGPGGPIEHAPSGPGEPVPHRDWHRGDRLPPDYRGPNYVVDDWRGYGLLPPPPGYQWVSVNGDYVLAAIATGVISSILLAPPR